jgi:hypothetical protein
MALAIAGPMKRANNEAIAEHDEDIRTLQLAYDDIVRERDRLRSARASVTRQLGPLPVSGGIAISVVGGLGRDRVDEGWLIVASGLLLLMVVVGILFSVLAPYRWLRAKHEDELAHEVASGKAAERAIVAIEHEVGFDEQLPPGRWLTYMIELERRVYGPLRAGRGSFRHPFKIRTLQDGFDAERTGLYLVQLLFVALIAVLVIGLLGGR